MSLLFPFPLGRHFYYPPLDYLFSDGGVGDFPHFLRQSLPQLYCQQIKAVINFLGSIGNPVQGCEHTTCTSVGSPVWPRCLVALDRCWWSLFPTPVVGILYSRCWPLQGFAPPLVTSSVYRGWCGAVRDGMVSFFSVSD